MRNEFYFRLHAGMDSLLANGMTLILVGGKLESNRCWCSYILLITSTCLPCNWKYSTPTQRKTMKLNEARQQITAW